MPNCGEVAWSTGKNIDSTHIKKNPATWTSDWLKLVIKSAKDEHQFNNKYTSQKKTSK